MTSEICKMIGLSKKELQNEVLERLVNRILDHDFGYEDHEAISYKFREVIKKQVDASVQTIATEVLGPSVNAYIDTIVLQETTSWGEKKGEPFSFKEYLVNRSENYLQEPVDTSGRAKGDRDYSSYGNTPRILFMIGKYLSASIESAMKDSLKTVNEALSKGLESEIKKHIKQLQDQIKVSVKL